MAKFWCTHQFAIFLIWKVKIPNMERRWIVTAKVANSQHAGFIHTQQLHHNIMEEDVIKDLEELYSAVHGIRKQLRSVKSISEAENLHQTLTGLEKVRKKTNHNCQKHY
jgi:hypothetical protein